MITRKSSKVIVLGITGRQGTFWTEKMLAYGTQVVAGVNPKRAGGRTAVIVATRRCER